VAPLGPAGRTPREPGPRLTAGPVANYSTGAGKRSRSFSRPFSNRSASSGRR
jgi:hypothetical protein